MNIFATSQCPEESAKNLCLRHKIRMPLETAGMLVFAFEENTTPIPNLRSNRHYKHPASIWARESRENYEWLLLHGLFLCDEYKKCYKREHDSQKHIIWCSANIDKIGFNSNNLTPFARCFSTFKTVLEPVIDTFKAYQEFYKLDKKDFARWPDINRIPNWWPEKSEKWVDKNFVGGQYIKR